MKFGRIIPLFALVAACDVTQELQGQGPLDGGSDASPVGSDGGLDAAPADAGTDGSVSLGPVSTCIPQVSSGALTTMVKGNELGSFRDVTDIAFGAGSAFALSQPWTVISVPEAGGPAVSFDYGASLPNFVAMDIAPRDTDPSGALSTPALLATNLPNSAAGQMVMARGPATSMASELSNRVVVDGKDVYFVQKASPARIVRAGSGANAEKLLVELPTQTGRVITAAKVVAPYVYFTSFTTTGLGYADGKLHRVPTAGGTVEELGSLGLSATTPVQSIVADGLALYLLPGGESASVSETFMIYKAAISSFDTGTLQGNGDNVAFARSSGVAFDGSYFYYGSTPSASGCGSRLVRVAKNVALGQGSAKAEILATNMDRILQLRVQSGKVWVGTASNPFAKPLPYAGQLFRWSP